MDTMVEGHQVATGQKTIQDMLNEAEAGVGAKTPYLKHLYSTYSGQPIDAEGVPREITDLMAGVKRTGLYADAPTVPLDDENRKYETFQLYKKFIFVREQHGGRMDPLFFATDVEGFSKVNPEQIRVVKAVPKPGAVGYQVSALGEWRVHTGDAVSIVEVGKVANLRYPRQ